jgi:thiosulfate/3-mercaptopyruvate sulfurtransferase
LIDFRSSEEYSGERVLGDDTPGHIPGARSVVWRELGQGADAILKPTAELAQIFARAGLKGDETVVAYCRSGPRAALGYLALRQAGYNVRLFDGSWAQWSRLGLSSEK